MKIIVCDDEPKHAVALQHRLIDYSALMDIAIECEVYTSSQAVLEADLTTFHVAFLDIDMPSINGMELAGALRQRYPELILIFVTSYIEYAPAGYRVNAFRYLLKTHLSEELPTVLDELQQRLYSSQATISLHYREGNTLVSTKSILYLEGTPNRRVFVHLINSQEPLDCSGKLGEYEQLLRDKGFLRIQKSFLVNMLHINRISNYRAFLRNGKYIKTTEKNYTQVCNVFLQWKGQQL